MFIYFQGCKFAASHVNPCGFSQRNFARIHGFSQILVSEGVMSVFYLLCVTGQLNKFFLGCSGPLDNARTIPEWLKNKLQKVKEYYADFFTEMHFYSWN